MTSLGKDENQHSAKKAKKAKMANFTGQKLLGRRIEQQARTETIPKKTENGRNDERRGENNFEENDARRKSVSTPTKDDRRRRFRGEHFDEDKGE